MSFKAMSNLGEMTPHLLSLPVRLTTILPAPGPAGGGRGGRAEGGQGQPPGLLPAQPLDGAGPHHRPRHHQCRPRHSLRRPRREDPPAAGAGGE